MIQVIEIKRPMDIKETKMKEEEYLQIQHAIHMKRKMLLKKQRQIAKLARQNTFLENIKKDYLQYNNYIIKQKQDQIRALELLNNYIEDLNRSGQLSDSNILDAKMEQRKIISELNSIKNGLDKIITETNNVESLIS
jgi:hypothetical protein